MNRTNPSARVTRVRSAFTLIELLVVIAIIAILASILFPVFAQAREKARQSSCISSSKQLANGVMMYNQDYDELMPLFTTTRTQDDAVPSQRNRGFGFVQPYIKAWRGVYTCPNQPPAIGAPAAAPAGSQCDVFDTCPGTTWPIAANMSIWSGYGFNVDYMHRSKVGCGAPPAGDFGWPAGDQDSGPPTAIADIASPAATIMAGGAALAPGTGSFAGANNLYPKNGGYYFLYSPATRTDSRLRCRYGNSGWGQGSFMGPYGGFESPRHNNMGGTVIFCDGHVKFMQAGQVAAGTNWSVDKLNTAITITDRNQYLWDLQ